MTDRNTEGWVVISFGGFDHVLPENEMDDHHPVNCQCQPTADHEDESIIIHNSFDGREAFERGARKLS